MLVDWGQTWNSVRGLFFRNQMVKCANSHDFKVNTQRSKSKAQEHLNCFPQAEPHGEKCGFYPFCLQHSTTLYTSEQKVVGHMLYVDF